MDTVNEELIRALGCTRNKVFKTLGRVFRSKGLTCAQFAVMEAILHNGAPLRVGELNDNVLGSTGNLPMVVRNLERMGYVATSHDEKDRRVRLVDLTPDGRTLFEEVISIHHQWLDTLLSGMDDGSKRELARLLELVSDSIDEALLVEKKDSSDLAL